MIRILEQCKSLLHCCCCGGLRFKVYEEKFSEAFQDFGLLREFREQGVVPAEDE